MQLDLPYKDILTWAIGITLCLSLFFSVWFVLYFKHFKHRYGFVHLITTFGLFVCICTMVITPLDIYLVSSTVDPATGLRRAWATKENVALMVSTLQTLYYAFYTAISVLCFLVFPFVYFYNEDIDVEQTKKERFMVAFKYTLFSFSIVSMLLLTGFFMEPVKKGALDVDYLWKFLQTQGIEKSLTFIIGILIVVGQSIFIVCTAYGLVVFPSSLITSRKDSTVDILAIESRLALVNERLRILSNPSSRLQLRLDHALSTELRVLRAQQKKFTEQLEYLKRYKQSCTRYFVKLFRPLEVVCGLVFFLLSITIIISMTVSCVDKAKNSLCGGQCGFLIESPEAYNPINYILLFSSKFSPLDYIFVVLLITYFFFSTLAGLIATGIRFLWVKLYNFKPRATKPQAILLSTVLLMLSLIALNYTVTDVITPQYARFGSQRYCNNTINGQVECSGTPELIIPCSLDDFSSDICTETVVSTIITRITVNTPILGSVYYYCQWLFILTFVASSIYNIFKRDNPWEVSLTEDDYLEDEERQPLLPH